MKFVEIGTVDVDSGMVMIGDPCYSLPDDASSRPAVARDWMSFCDAMGSAPHAEPLGAGVAIVVRPLCGDGRYPVIAEVTSQGSIRRVILDFDLEGD